MRKNHDVSLSMKNVVVEKFTEEKQTLKFGGDLFDIRKTLEEFQEKDCAIKCLECTTCLHSYVCSCSNYGLRRTICKNIHYIASRTDDNKEHNFSTQLETST